MPELALLVLVIAAAIGFGVVNGFNDAANAVAASVGSRSISPRNAIILAAFCDFAGAATGLEVARTIGKGILLPDAISYLTLIAALAAVIVWGTVATRLGLRGLGGCNMACPGADRNIGGCCSYPGLHRWLRTYGCSALDISSKRSIQDESCLQPPAMAYYRFFGL